MVSPLATLRSCRFCSNCRLDKGLLKKISTDIINILTLTNISSNNIWETVDSNVASLKRCQFFLMISSTQKQPMKPSYGSHGSHGPHGSHGTQALSGLNGEYGVYATGPSRDDISVDPEKVRHLYRWKDTIWDTQIPNRYGFPFVATWWLIPLSKWVITPVINGISRVNPLITGVITHLLSG